MAYEIRPITEDEYLLAYKVCSAAFGEDVTEENRQAERMWWEAERSLGAYDGGELVATAGAYTFDVTLPGGSAVPAAGVTWVGVLPSHRRRGTLRSLMDRQLDDVAARGESIAVLTASDAAIYGRFGYGVATQFAKVKLLVRSTGFHRDPAVGGRFRLMDSEAARKVVPAVHDRWRRTRAGLISRSDRYWDLWATDPKDWRDGGSARYVVVHEDDAGVADGYATYRVHEAWAPERPGNTAALTEVVADDPDVEAALFRFVLDIDLLWDVRLERRPLDDPLRYWLTDSRAYGVHRINDWLWVRLVDPAAAMAARRYPFDGRLAVGITDPFRPANDGVYVIDGGPDGASCTRADGGVEPDVTMPIDTLGAAFLGGVPLTALAAAGRVGGRGDDVTAAGRFLATAPAPFCDLPF